MNPHFYRGMNFLTILAMFGRKVCFNHSSPIGGPLSESMKLSTGLGCMDGA